MCSRSSLFHIPCLYVCPIVITSPEVRTDDRDDDDENADNTATQNAEIADKSPENNAATEGQEPKAGTPSQGEKPASQQKAGSRQSQRPASQPPPQGDEREETALGLYECPVYMNKVGEIEKGIVIVKKYFFC
jgi:hypothetical protein